MKAKLFSFLLALAASVGTIIADGTKIGDLYYNLDAENRTAEVTYQEQYSENNYSGLTSADIPSSVTYNNQTYSVTSIGGSAFRDCSSLTSVIIPNSVTSIGDYAFLLCSSLTSVTIPNSVTSIGDAAFDGCSGLTSIIVEAGNTAYDSRDNCNAIIETSTNTLIAGCQNTVIPNSVTSIGGDAFGGITGLTSITIPNSVTSIGDRAFVGCSGLISVTIPNSVTSIGEGAFYGCSSLTSVYNYAVMPQAIDSNVFEEVNKNICTLYVPEGAIALYQSANVWKDFGSIKAAPELSAVEQIRQNTKTQKTITNGQLLIIKNGRTFNATGAVVK